MNMIHPDRRTHDMQSRLAKAAALLSVSALLAHPGPGGGKPGYSNSLGDELSRLVAGCHISGANI